MNCRTPKQESGDESPHSKTAADLCPGPFGQEPAHLTALGEHVGRAIHGARREKLDVRIEIFRGHVILPRSIMAQEKKRKDIREKNLIHKEFFSVPVLHRGTSQA